MLKTLSKATESLDQEILKNYQNIARNYEKKGVNTHDIAFWCGTISGPLTSLSEQYFGKVASKTISYIFLPDRVENLFNIMGFPSDALTKIILNINRNIRLATFMSSPAMMIKAGYEVMQYYTNKEPNLESGIEAGLIGVGLILRASSIYLKDKE
jgi:hypothetical protein